MPQTQLRRFEQILQNEISLVVSRSRLSDVTNTSDFGKVLKATSRELDEAYFQLTRLTDLFDLSQASGEDLDERAKEIQPGTLKRIKARRAVGTIVFSRNSSTVGDVTIPTGTIVKTAAGILFRTTLQGAILNAQASSTAIPVTAENPGAVGNVPAGTIVKFASKPAGVDSVTNAAGMTQGRDKEADDAFRQRLRNYLASLSRCPVQALEFAAVGTEDPVSGKAVAFAHIFEDPVDAGKVTLYIDDGAGTASTLGTPVVGEVVTANLAGPPAGSAIGGEEFLKLTQKPIDKDGSAFTVTSSIRGALTLGTNVYLNPVSGLLFFDPPLAAAEVITASYTPFIDLIPVVQKVIEGDPDDRQNFPGYRAGGVRVRVLSPVVVTQGVEAVLTLATGTDRDTAVAAAQDAVMDYINNLGISGDVIRNKLIERIMEVSGVTDVNMTIPASNTPGIILDNQIARTSLSNISIS